MLYDGASDWRRCRSGSMLTSEQRTEFDERGFVRIPSAFTAAEASSMEDLVWAHVEARAGVIRGDPSTWNLTMVVGLGHLKTDPAFAAIGSPATVAALDDVLGEDRWVRPKNWGQLLVTFPTPDAEWTVPSDVWHTDFDYQLPPGEIAGALVFAFLTDVGPGAGGTVVVAGSHRLVRRYVEDQPREALEKMKMKQVRKAFLASDPWLRALSSDRDDGDREERFMGADHEVGGVPVRVVELTGRAGDVVVGHPWLLHAPAPNCGTSPRFMTVQRVKVAAGGSPEA